MKAIRTVFKPVGKNWAEDTKNLASSRVKVRTGKTKQSIRVKNASMRRAAVEAREGARFLEGGTQAHTMTVRRFEAMRFNAGGLPRFAKKVRHPGAPKQPFLRNSGADVLHRMPMAQELIKLWNKAA